MHSQKQNKQETKQKNTQWNNSKKKKAHKASKYIHEHAQYTQAQVITQFNH